MHIHYINLHVNETLSVWESESEVNVVFFRKSGKARAEMDFKMNSITH